MPITFYSGQTDYIAQLNALVALVGGGGGGGGGVTYTPFSISITGTPAVPIRLLRAVSPVVDKLDGTQLTPASGFAAAAFNYVEGTPKDPYAGGLVGESSMTSLVFNDLNCLTSGMAVSGSLVLTTLGFPALVLLGNGTYKISNLLALTTLNLSALKMALGPVTLSGLINLPAVNLTNLTDAAGLNFRQLSAMTTFSAPALVSCSGPLTFGGTALTSLSLPALTGVQNGALTVSDSTSEESSVASVSGNASLTSISAPSLVLADLGLNLSAITALTSVNFSALALIGSLNLEGASPLTTFALPALVRCGPITVSRMASLTTFTLGATLKQVYGNVALTGCALNQASVDGVLSRLAGLNGSGGTVSFNGPLTVALNGGTSSAPSSAGLTSKATLQSRGVTVIHN